MNSKVFKEAIAYRSTVYEAIKPEAVDVYNRHLNDLSDDDLRGAVKKCIENRRSRDFPSIADIRYYAGKDLNSIADNAISKLKRVAQKKSDCNSIQFSDRTLNATAARYADWVQISDWSEEDWSYNYKRLMDLYKSFKRQGVEEEKIVGYDEQRNLPYKLHKIGEIGAPMITTGYIKPKQIENKTEE